MDTKLLVYLQEKIDNCTLSLTTFSGNSNLEIIPESLKDTIYGINFNIVIFVQGKIINRERIVESLEYLNNTIDEIKPIYSYTINNKETIEFENNTTTKSKMKIIFTPYDQEKLISDNTISYITTNCNSSTVLATLKKKDISKKQWLIDSSNKMIEMVPTCHKILKEIIKFTKRYK
jgi:hypothetical protein